MSFDPNLDGPFAPVRRAAGDESPAWPVLARLPLVGVRDAASSERLPTYAELEPASPKAGEVRTPAPLRVVEAPPVAAPTDQATTHFATRIDPPQIRGQTIMVGPHSTPARALGWVPMEEALPPPAELIAPPAPPRRAQYRIDVAEDRFQGSRSARRQVDDSLAARVARRHAAAAPYAGVAVTAALIIAASLLYGLTVGRQSAIGGDELVNPQNSWSSETPIAPPVSAAATPTPREVASPIDEVDSLLTSPESPRVADAAAATPEATTPEAVETAAPADGPALGTGAEPPPSTAAVEPATPVVPAPLAATPITPTPNDSPYPTTDYPWFEFGLPPATGDATPATADNGAVGGAPGQERAQ